MTTVQLLICGSAMSLAFSLKKRGKKLLKAPGTLPLLLLISWMILQALSLPPFITKTISPASYEIYKPITDLSAQNQWLPITVNQKATLFECMRIASYALFYYLTVQILSDGQKLKKTIRLVSYLAIGIAFLAIIQKLSSPDHIYWFRRTPEGAGTVGPWVYHNHYAGFMEMMCPLVLALFIFYQPAIDHNKPLRSRIAEICSMPGSNLHIFFGGGILVIISSIFLSLSRGGIVSLTLALLFFVFVLPKKAHSFKWLTYGFLICAVALLVTWFGWGPVVEKFGRAFTDTGAITNMRLQLWQDSFGIFRDFFLTGSGFGTFIYSYPLYKTVPYDLILDHAHNDYIELLTDGGIIGFTFAAWFVLAVISHAWKNLKIRGDRFAVLLSIGALTGIVSILFHSVTDFNMHNGANGLYFFFLCGLLVSTVDTRIYYRTRPTLLEEAGSHNKFIIIGLSILLLGLAIVVRGGAMVAKSDFSKVANTYLSRNLHQDKVREVAFSAKRASQYDPLEGKYSFALGNAQIFLQEPENAFTSFTQAARKNPLSGLYLQKLALMLTTTDKSGAEELMAIAYARALEKTPLIVTWAEWMLSINQREKAVATLTQIFAERPNLVNKFIPTLALFRFNRHEMKEVLPDSVSAWAQYGSLAEKQGNIEDAEFFRSHALDFIDQEDLIHPWYYKQLYRFYKRQKKFDKALIVLREASERLPEHAQFHVYLGDYYKKEGVLYRAKEEYEEALLLEPADEKTRKKLESLERR